MLLHFELGYGPPGISLVAANDIATIHKYIPVLPIPVMY